jgi:hypothetical protein
MSGAVHPLPQYAFMAWYSVKAQGCVRCTIYVYGEKLINLDAGEIYTRVEFIAKRQ